MTLMLEAPPSRRKCVTFRTMISTGDDGGGPHLFAREQALHIQAIFEVNGFC